MVPDLWAAAWTLVMRTLILILCFCGCRADARPLATPGPLRDDTLLVFILAGQSNALNWHCDAALLPANPADSTIPFFFHMGAPPDRSYPVPFNTTSGEEWTTLRAQRQDPYIALREFFFGPEMGLGRTLASGGKRVALVKCAYFGTDLIHDWHKGDTSGAGLYALMFRQISVAERKLDSAGIAFRYGGFFWMQGESDAASAAASAAYRDNLTRFIQDIRQDLAVPGLPFVLGRIGNASSYAYKSVVRNAQVDVAAAVEGVRWVDTDDLPLDTDNIHLVAPGALLLGERMGREWMSMPTGIASDFPDAPSVDGAYPNPFNASTVIRFRLPIGGNVAVRVFDIVGRDVATIPGNWYPAGVHEIRFNAPSLASGAYIYRLESAGFLQSGALRLVR